MKLQKANERFINHYLFKPGITKIKGCDIHIVIGKRECSNLAREFKARSSIQNHIMKTQDR